MDLFSNQENAKELLLPLDEASVTYYPKAFSDKANMYFDTLLKEINWQQDSITVFGKTHPQPRLTALHGEENLSYSYSGITMNTIPFTPTLLEIKKRIEEHTKSTFNVVLLNLYRNGQDSNGWHSDNEKELGKNPSIASVSLGAKRKFQFRKISDRRMRHTIELESGSLLLMEGQTQHTYQHQIPKTKKEIGQRINLTFRLIR